MFFGFPKFLPFFKSLPSRRLRVFDLERDGWPQTPDAHSIAGLTGCRQIRAFMRKVKNHNIIPLL